MGRKNGLAAARKMRGLTQRQLAEKAGTTFQLISSYERGRKELGPVSVPAFVAALGVEPSYLRGEAVPVPVVDPLRGNVAFCPAMRCERVKGYGMFYLVDHPETGPLAVIVTDGGAQLTLSDRQGPQPRDAAEARGYRWPGHRWVDAAGRRVAQSPEDGLPRITDGPGSSNEEA